MDDMDDMDGVDRVQGKAALGQVRPTSNGFSRPAAAFAAASIDYHPGPFPARGEGFGGEVGHASGHGSAAMRKILSSPPPNSPPLPRVGFVAGSFALAIGGASRVPTCRGLWWCPARVNLGVLR